MEVFSKVPGSGREKKKKPVKIVMSIWNEERFSGTPGNPEGKDRQVGGM